MNCLALDAMGVIFRSADDVAELLIPFIAEKSGTVDEKIVQSAYLQASLGKIGPDDFWNQVGVASELEDEYLSRHSLNPGITELLSLARDNGFSIWCLSNDVGRWSEKLRANLGIENYLTGSVISGHVGVRKPDKEIYEVLIRASGYKAEDILFVDDREKNVVASRAAGIETAMFNPATGFTGIKNRISQAAL